MKNSILKALTLGLVALACNGALANVVCEVKDGWMIYFTTDKQGKYVSAKQILDDGLVSAADVELLRVTDKPDRFSAKLYLDGQLVTIKTIRNYRNLEHRSYRGELIKAGKYMGVYCDEN